MCSYETDDEYTNIRHACGIAFMYLVSLAILLPRMNSRGMYALWDGVEWVMGFE